MDATATTIHPLDPLGPDELERAMAALRREGDAGAGARVISIDLLEPDKAALKAWREGGQKPRREALAVLIGGDGGALECLVAVDEEQVAERRPLAGMQPAVSMDEYVEAGRVCREDAGFREALARRGITGDAVELVHVEPWTVGAFEGGERRVARCLAWLRSSLDDVNPYGRPIGRLVAVVDLHLMQVVRIDDHGVLPVPDHDADYRNGGGSGYRSDLRPIEITQPEGVSFTLHGRELRWQKWRLRVGFSPARAWCCTRSATRTTASCARSAPCLDRRAGDPLRRSQPDRALQERIRHRRVRGRPAGERARAGLRLPGRHHLPGCRLHRRAAAAWSRCQTRSASTRRTTASSGSTATTTPAAPMSPARGGW